MEWIVNDATRRSQVMGVNLAITDDDADAALLLHRTGEVKDCAAQYGHVIVDECHHLTAFSRSEST